MGRSWIRLKFRDQSCPRSSLVYRNGHQQREAWSCELSPTRTFLLANNKRCWTISPGYNVRVHGPYNPARNYGPADTKFTEVKLADLVDWLRRRDTRVSGMWRGINRGYWKWTTKWLHVRSGTTAAVAQWTFAMALMSYCMQYKWLTYHRIAKYH